jgi:choline kinase
MQAIILAAGMGKRLGDLTKNNTKCMIKVNGITLIERLLTQLDNLNLSKIILVVGYKSKELISFINTFPLFSKRTFITRGYVIIRIGYYRGRLHLAQIIKSSVSKFSIGF